MIRHPCPPADSWRALLTEDLPPAEQADLSGHLELCPACQRTLEDCAAHRDAWAAARTLGVLTQPRSPVLCDVIDRLKLDPQSDHDDHNGAELPLDFLDPPEHPGSLGRIGPYEVLEEIGRGGMGVVLKALDPSLHRVVAIKVLAPQLAVSGTARKRFTREARAAAAVGHENVVTIHAVEEFKGLPYLVMQYVAGPSVQQRLADGGPLPVAEILRIGLQTAAGLAAAHAQGLVHRDVKPANILLENGVERVKLTDFSLARAIDDASVTQTGVVTGTPPYMAPEQARGEPLDHRADLFSLGSVLYALCTGRAPFRGKSLDVLRKVSEETPVSIRSLNPEIPTWLETIVNKLMTKNPDGRYQSAGDVAAVLEQCLAHVQQPTVVPLPAGLAEKRKAHWLAIALPILAGVFVIAAVMVMRIKTDNGTLEITLDDPNATVTVDKTDIVVSGIKGVKEFRLKAGDYTVHQTKDGKPEKTEVVSIKQGEKTPLRVAFEGDKAATFVSPLRNGPRSEVLPFIGDVFQNAAEEDKAMAELRALQALAANAKDEAELRAIQLKLAVANVRARAKFGTVVTRPQRSFPTEAGEVAAAVFSPDGKTLFASDRAWNIVAYDFVTGKTRFNDSVSSSGDLHALAVSPDGSGVAAVGVNGQICVLDSGSGRVKKYSFLHASVHYNAVGFSADGKTLAAGGSRLDGHGGLLELWDLESEKVRTVEFADSVMSLAFPPGREDRLAVGTSGTDVHMVYPSSGREEYALRQHGPVRGMGFSQNGKWLAASTANLVELWDWQQGRAGATLTGHDRSVRTARFSPDSKWLVTASLDGTAKLWDMSLKDITSTGYVKQCVTIAPGTYKTGMAAALFTPDGKSIITAGDDHLIRVWDLAAVNAGSAKPANGAVGVPVLSDVPVLGELFRNQVAREREKAEAARAEAEANFKAARAAEARARDGIRVTRPQRCLQAGADGPIFSVAFAHDGKHIVIAGPGRPTEEADVSQGWLSTYAGRRGQVVVSADGMTFAAGGEHQSVDVWDLRLPKQFRELKTIPPTVYALALTPDGKTLAIGGRTDKGAGVVQLWDVETAKVRSIDFPVAVLSLAFDMGGQNRLAVGLNADDVRMVDTKKAEVIYNLPQPGPIDQVAFSHDAKWLATTEGGNVIHLWDWQVSRMAATLTGHTDRMTSVRFSPDGKWLASASLDGTARLWDVASSRTFATFAPNAGKLYVAEFAPDGKSLITAGEDRTIRVWSLAALTSEVTGARPVEDTVKTFAPSPTQSITPAQILQAERLARFKPLPPRIIRLETRESISSAVFATDGKDLIVAGPEGNICAYDFGSGQKRFAISGKHGENRYLAVSRDGKLLASGGDEPTVHQWDAATGRQIRTLNTHAERVTGLAFSGNGHTLAVGALLKEGGQVFLCDAPSESANTTFNLRHPVVAVACSPIGNRMAFGMADGVVRLIGRPSFTDSVELKHPASVAALDFSPDGKTLAVACYRSVHFWDVATAKEQFMFRSDGGRIESVRYSPDGRLIAVAGADGIARLWAADSHGEVLLPPEASAGKLYVAEFAPDGKSLITAGEDRNIRVWDLSPLLADLKP